MIARGRGGEKGVTAERLQETFWNGENALYHGCGGGCVTACICVSSLNCTLKIGEYYFK